MDKPMPDSHFKVMSFLIKLRDILSPRIKVLREVDIKPGDHILDYGCGPGSYIVSTAKLVGDTGRIFALDIHPLAIQKVKNLVSKKGLINVKIIKTECRTGLPDNSINVVLLYDIFHLLGNPNEVLMEIHRVLKDDGFLSFSDHHMEENEIITKLTDNTKFKFLQKGKYTFTFKPY